MDSRFRGNDENTMHHIYTTKSIILKREVLDESAYYYLLTADLGLIHARAQGVRKEQSRLKGALQEFSLATVAFVHGKAGFKITTAIPHRNFFIDAKNDTVRKILAHIALVLIRFIVGQEKNSDIFTVIERGFEQLVVDEKDARAIESIILVRLLYILGYVPNTVDTADILKDFSDFNTEVLSFAEQHRVNIIKAINQAFTESQM